MDFTIFANVASTMALGLSASLNRGTFLPLCPDPTISRKVHDILNTSGVLCMVAKHFRSA